MTTDQETIHQVPLWVDIIVKLTPAFITLVVGLVASAIGYLQYKINHDKLRLDLFNKRLEAYEKLQEFFIFLIREGGVSDKALSVLAEAKYKSRFLFHQEIEESIDVVWKKAVEIQSLGERLYGLGSLPVGPERTAVCELKSSLLKWMMNEMESSPKRYARYLRFE
ncbi:MAG: hypothetical protein NT105_06180 [Verrucomicrobia bacterium]|nr:hypothetical protein [Verrucomicrobiota bacterium]